MKDLKQKIAVNIIPWYVYVTRICTKNLGEHLHDPQRGEEINSGYNYNALGSQLVQLVTSAFKANGLNDI